MSHWGDSYGSSLGESPAKPKQKRVPPSQLRHTTDDDASESEDPILLTAGSSQPGSPVKPAARGRRPDDDRPRAAPAKNKQAMSERERARDVLKAQNGARGASNTAPMPPKGAKKRVVNPFNAAYTSKPRGAASSAPAAAKARQPAAKPPASTRTNSRAYDAEDEDAEAEPTPKPRKTTHPLFTKKKNMKSDTDASPSAPRAVLPFQAELDKKKARDAAAAASPSPSSQQPRPHPMAGMKPFKPAPAPASPKLAPFPLQHMIDANSNPSTSPKPAPYPLAGKQGKTATRDPHTPAASKVVTKKSIVDKVVAGLDMFDTPSPVRPELLSKTVAPFPMDSPISTSSSTSSKPKSSSSISSAGVRPFPLKLPSKVSPKRPAEEGTDSDRPPKRRKHAQEAPPKSPVMRPTITQSPGSPESPKQPAVDPARLCPYCDELLPETRSPEFEELLRVARAKSWPKPRRANPRGLKAPMTVFVSVCERHRFEAKVLPQAIRAGWPTKIDFDSIPARVKRKRRILDDILKDPSTSSFFREAMENVARVGARVAESAMGQYAIFERIQPGYYGERGAVVMHQTLFSLYTPEDLQKSHHLFAPLSTQTFQHSVLVPEAALALIMEDRGETRAQALKTMRASSRYGNLMFPDDDEADGVGEAMMRERARQRRIEIEKEEREEMEAERLAAEAEKKAKAKKSKSKATDTESQTDASTSRKKTTKSKAKAEDDGMESCDSTATRRSARISRNTQRATPAGDESGTDASTTSNRPARAVKVKTRVSSYLEVSDSDDDPITLVAPKAKKPVARAPALPAHSGDEPVKTKKKRASPVVDSDDEPVVLSIQKAKKRSASPRASSRAPKKAATSRLSPTATATDSDSTALSDLSEHSRARRARQGSSVIDLTSDPEERSPASSLASRRSQAGKPPSTSSRGSTRNKYAFMDSSGSEDEAIPDAVMQGLQHQSPPLTQRPSSPQRRKVPSRASSRSRAAPTDDDLQATPVARRQHTRWDDHGKPSEAMEEVTPRPVALLRTSSYGSHRSNGSSKGFFQPRSADSWLLSTSSPFQKPAQAQQSPSRESNYEEDAEDFFNMTMELSD